MKVAAEQLELPVFQPERIKIPEAIEQLRELVPEVIIVVAYGQILSSDILKLPPKGCINVHASLLPKYRGAAPIHWVIMNGETETGVTTMLMDKGLDTGDMLLKAVYPISEEATTGEIEPSLAHLGAELLLKTLDHLERGILVPEPQVGETSYASLLKREHEEIDWTRSAREIHNQIRALNPHPGSFTTFHQENLKIWRSGLNSASDPSLVDSEERVGVPGEVVRVIKEGIVLQTGLGQILVQEVQPAGKKSMRNNFV